MNLSEIDLLKLQSAFMQKDSTTQGLCAALTPPLQEIAGQVEHILLWPRIENLTEDVLDELAWQLHMDWYDATADIETKKALIKNAIEVHRKRGTPQAVEEIIQTYFGDGYVEEWFEYGGEPYMFRVITNNATVTGEQAQQFIKVLNAVKNMRSRLETIIISMTAEMDLYIAGVVHTGDNITIRQVV